MNDQEMPPWLSLPEEVRKRVCERMSQEAPGGPGSLEQDKEMMLEDLRELSAKRLVEAVGLKKAMKLGQPYPGYKTKEEWNAAVRRCQAKILEFCADPAFVLQAALVHQIVREELAAFHAKN